MIRNDDVPNRESDVPQHDLTSYERGKGLGEALVDLARHRRPEDLAGPLIAIGILLLVLAGAGFVLLLVQSGAVQSWGSLIFLVAIAILALVLVGVGLAFRVTTRGTQKHS